jgi:hypothetical protein
MTTPPLSPAAQRIANLASDLYDVPLQFAAAAIRALAETEGVKPEAVGPCDEAYGWLDPSPIQSARDRTYELALQRKRAKTESWRILLAIAAELDGGAGQHTTQPTEITNEHA